MQQKFNSQMSKPLQESQTPFGERLVFVAQRNLLFDGESFSLDGAEFGVECALGLTAWASTASSLFDLRSFAGVKQ
ncbi:MAG: hypothetical protein WBS19_12360 [Candidatus Korobacteraceae bacterium]